MPKIPYLRNTCSPSSLVFLCFILIFSTHGLLAQSAQIAESYQDAQNFIKEGEYKQALSLNEEIISKLSSPGDKDLLLLYNQRGYLLSLFVKLDSAQFYLDKAFGIALQDSSSYGLELGELYHNSALVHMESPDPSGLQEKIQRAIEYRNLHDPERVIESEILMGRFLMKTGQIPAAEKYYESLVKNYPDRNGYAEGQLYYHLGVNKIFLRKPQEALDLFKQSEAAFLTYFGGKDHPQMVFTYSYLGFVYSGYGKLLTARKNSEKALELQHKFFDPDHKDFGILYYYAAGIYTNMAEFEKAANYLKEALRIDEIYTGKELNSRSANYYMSLGAAYKGMNDFEASIDANLKAVDYYTRQEGQNPFMDQLYANLGMTYNDQGDTDKALEYLELSYQLASQKFSDTHPSMIIRFKAFADCYLKRGNTAKSLEYYEKLSAIEAKRSGGISSNLAKFLSDQGEIWRKHSQDKAKALSFQKQALAALGMEALLENPGLPMSKEARDSPKYLVGICSEIGKLLSEYGETEEEIFQNQLKALEILKAGEVLLDSTRNRYLTEGNKLGLAKSSRFLYETAIELSYDLYQKSKDQTFLATAFRMTEKSKALILLLGLKHVQALQSAGIPESLLEKEQELEIQLMQAKNTLQKLKDTEGQPVDSLQKALFTLEESRDSLIKNLEQNFPQYYRLKYQPNIPTISEVQKDLLEEGQAGLIYFLGRKNLFTFCVGPTAITFHKKELPDRFRERVQKYRDLIYAPLNSGTDEDFRQTESQLVQESRFFHDFLLADLQSKEHSAYTRLRIIPDGILSLMNFDLLMARAPTQTEGVKDYDFALKKYGISMAYSTGLLQYLYETQSTQAKHPDLLAFQPTYPTLPGQEEIFAERRAGFGPLKFSQKEIEGISNWYDMEVLTGDKASEENFYAQARNFPIIHISSHAQVPESNPRAAFVALTSTENAQYDDSLMIEELYAQRLQADMVVLSACETGSGQLAEGEGILSLGRAFTYAGARSLVMSLWEVNDASTADIMTQFYRHLAGGMPKDMALRQAKLDYLATSDKLRSQPYFWAAFVASGEMKPLPYKKSSLLFWLIGLLVLGGAVMFGRKRF